MTQPDHMGSGGATASTVTPPDPFDRLREFFKNQRDGRAAAEFADAIAEVAKGVMAHGKGGKVSLTVSLTPLKNVDGAMRIADTIKATVPQAPQSESIFYGQKNGDLSREHPAQRRIPGVERNAVGEDPPIDLRRLD